MRILLVEDDHPLAQTLMPLLREQNMTVDWLDDGRLALRALLDTPFDAAILDLTLPNLDGTEVLRRARAEGCTTPILVLTARGGLNDRLEGLDSGADDYLGKPFAMAELLARLRAICRRSGGQAHPLLKVGKLSLDPVHHAVHWQGNLLSLSRTEYQLLEHFMRHPGQVVTRHRLDEQLYGWSEGVESNALEVHIHNLRKKLGKHAIQTLRGVGYLLRPDALEADAPITPPPHEGD
ncbi:MAG: response regulator transcription factor [Gammaproteobacteria bacterium]|nr:response regulator transcription factor [Gammaproteobacteria bacterium]